jgi:hypothetical protein
MVDCLGEECGAQIRLVGLVNGSYGHNNRYPLEESDVIRMKVFMVDSKGRGNLAPDSMSTRDRDVDLAGIYVTELIELEGARVGNHALGATWPEDRFHVSVERARESEGKPVETMAATLELPPFCHPHQIDGVDV